MHQNGLRKCPVCESIEFSAFRFGHLKCNHCHLVVSLNIWKPQENSAMDAVFGQAQPDKTFWQNLQEQQNNHRTLSRIAAFDPPGHRFLDIGVGTGALLVAAKKSGYEVSGCDLSEPICKRIQSTYNIPCIPGPISALNDKGPFDVIVINHVLEHVNHPIDFVNDIAKLLSPGGIVHIAVPNVASLEAKFSGWTAYVPYHLAYFTPETLAATVLKGGLSIEKLVVYDSYSGWFLTLLKTIKQQFKNPAAPAANDTAENLENIPIRNPPSLKNHAKEVLMYLFGYILLPLRWLQCRFNCGDEVICIAIKASPSP